MPSSLARVRAGDAFEILAVPDDDVRAKLLRLGLLDGAVECRRHIRDGPVVVARNGTQLAIGAALADRIAVEPIH